VKQSFVIITHNKNVPRIPVSPRNKIYLYTMNDKESLQDEAAFVFKEKRKWQIALRRYVLNGNKSSEYAPYFGIDSENFRKWIALQFTEDQHWDNFSTAWQFDHIMPVAFFDLKKEEDLRLCWNFINIRVEYLEKGRQPGKTPEIFAARHYFQQLYQATGLPFCSKMLEKIKNIEDAAIASTEKLAGFIAEKQAYLEALAPLAPYDYDKLNAGTSIERVIEENNLLKRFS
jgi:hypothetical protein